MKKYLPNLRASKGFTLIELLVVISIIAILSIIGISIFGSAQANARDGVRRAELNNLAKSIETTKDISGTFPQYKYTDTNFASDYPQNKPKDPSVDSTKSLYCVATSTGTTPAMPATPTSWVVNTNCPADAAGTGFTAWVKLVDNTSAYNTAAAGSSLVGTPPTSSTIASGQNGLMTGVKYWKICTRLETSGNIICNNSLNP